MSIVSCAPVNAHGTDRGGARQKQIKMTKNAYKELIMETQTESARQVRKYYICLEDLFTQYLLYQQAYQTVLSTNRFEILTLENKALSDKLDRVLKQNDQQTRLLETQSRQLEVQSQKLDVVSRILYKESDHKVLDVKQAQKKQELVVLQNRVDTTQCEIIRGQRNHVNQQLKRKHETMEIIGKIDTYKNPINLYNRFNEHVDSTKFDVRNNHVTLKNGSTADDLLRVLHDLDDDKHDVAENVRNAI